MKKNGFTLLETLVALFIIGVTLSGIYAVIMKNTQQGVYVEHTFVASGLAQEGLEIVRNIRDSAWLGGQPFGFTPGTYRVQWDTSVLVLGDPAATSPLLLDPATKMYSYTSGTPSLYSRTITIASITADEVRVIVDVDWIERGAAKTISAEEHLFNWY